MAIMLLVASVATAAPGLSLSESSFDFGIVPQQARVSHIFWVKSTGNETLHISQVVPGCGCTKAPLENNVLPAGDSTRLEIIFGTGAFTNSVIKSPRIETDAIPPVTNMHIKAFVVVKPNSTYPIIIRPFLLDMSHTAEGDRTETTFSITNVSDSPLKPILVSSDPRFVNITLPKIVPAGRTAEGQVRLTRAGAARELGMSFTIELNDAQSTRFTVPIKREIKVVTTSTSSTGKH